MANISSQIAKKQAVNKNTNHKTAYAILRFPSQYHKKSTQSTRKYTKQLLVQEMYYEYF